MSGNIKVVVRCRPLNTRELARGATGLVRMEGVNTFLDPPAMKRDEAGRVIGGEKHVQSFAFDKSYWSAGSKDDSNYASQETVFELGAELLDHSFAGFNTCIFAYGQTGSGKSYTMMGFGQNDRGIIPLICESLFERIKTLSTNELSFTVEVSYIEIYQEKVRDLLNPANKTLKVRESPSLGPYVEASRLAVQDNDEVSRLMTDGTRSRTVAATNMNETSSRSHAVFTLYLVQKQYDSETKLAGEKVSRISLVDLAGSERANSTGATGIRLKEGSLINKSLTTLGRVISALVAASSTETEEGTPKKSGTSGDKVPYRDSVLTFLLKDSLGGNSKTAMIATISPADYEETLSTLRYANQAKKIRNRAVVNEEPSVKYIRELKEELALLRSRASESETSGDQQLIHYKNSAGQVKTITRAELQEQCEENERLMAQVTETWEDKLAKTREIAKAREAALESLGIMVEKNMLGIHVPQNIPHLVNLCEDPLMSECLLYQVKPGRTVVGNASCDKPADIRLSGPSILPEHCHFENVAGKVTIHARTNGLTMVNGLRMSASKPVELVSGGRVILGDFLFRFNHPEAARRARDTGTPLRTAVVHDLDHDDSSGPGTRADSPTLSEADWSYAKKESVVARFNGANVLLDKMKDKDLDQLYADILQVRNSRNPSSAADRSESRASNIEWAEEAEDDESSSLAESPRPRPFSSATWSTADTSLADEGSIITVVGGYEAEERLQALKEREVMELKVKALQVEMQLQADQYEARVRKLVAQSPVGKVGRARLSDHEVELARWVVTKWRTRRRVNLAEACLSGAMELKEANVVSQELTKATSYQFVVVEEEIPTCRSLTSLIDLDDITDSMSSTITPYLGVKVLDRRHSTVALLTMAKFRQRLAQLRALHSAKPEFAHHFTQPEEESVPQSFVGSALFSLLPLARQLPAISLVQIYSPYTADPIGACYISLRPTMVVDSLAAAPAISLEIVVDRVLGLSSSEFASVHLQLDQSQLFGPSLESIEDQDGVMSSPVFDLDLDTSTLISFHQTIQIVITPAIQQHLLSSYASVHFFAMVKLSHLDKIERWDEAREGLKDTRIANSTPVRSDDPFDGDVTRRAENELVNEQRHDVIVAVEILELGAKGSYACVPVSLDTGAFFLHQGLQRRLSVRLNHNSGRAWEWQRLTRVSIGQVRLLDERGRIHAPSSNADVELKSRTMERSTFSLDGNAALEFTAPWDSSQHNSQYLDNNSLEDQRTLLRLALEIDGGSMTPVTIEMDLAITVQPRDARAPSKLFGLVSTPTSNKFTELFAIRLTPHFPKSPTDIWRVNTSDIYVRGQETLGNWKPRGLSLVRDYDRYIRDRRKVADVEATKAILVSLAAIKVSDSLLSDDYKLRDVISLWQSYPPSEILIHRATDVFLLSHSTSMSKLAAPKSVAVRDRPLIGHVSLVDKTGAVLKRGYLNCLRDPSSNQWTKYWAVLRRPYLHLYDSSLAAEMDQVGVINLGNVRVEQTDELEKMLQKKFVFALFTQQNSFFVQAVSAKEASHWIKLIDPSMM